MQSSWLRFVCVTPDEMEIRPDWRLSFQRGPDRGITVAQTRDRCCCSSLFSGRLLKAHFVVVATIVITIVKKQNRLKHLQLLMPNYRRGSSENNQARYVAQPDTL